MANFTPTEIQERQVSVSATSAGTPSVAVDKSFVGQGIANLGALIPPAAKIGADHVEAKAIGQANLDMTNAGAVFDGQNTGVDQTSLAQTKDVDERSMAIVTSAQTDAKRVEKASNSGQWSVTQTLVNRKAAMDKAIQKNPHLASQIRTAYQNPDAKLMDLQLSREKEAQKQEITKYNTVIADAQTNGTEVIVNGRLDENATYNAEMQRRGRASQQAGFIREMGMEWADGKGTLTATSQASINGLIHTDGIDMTTRLRGLHTKYAQLKAAPGNSVLADEIDILYNNIEFDIQNMAMAQKSKFLTTNSGNNVAMPVEFKTFMDEQYKPMIDTYTKLLTGISEGSIHEDAFKHIEDITRLARPLDMTAMLTTMKDAGQAGAVVAAAMDVTTLKTGAVEMMKSLNARGTQPLFPGDAKSAVKVDIDGSASATKVVSALGKSSALGKTDEYGDDQYLYILEASMENYEDLVKDKDNLNFMSRTITSDYNIQRNKEIGDISVISQQNKVLELSSRTGYNDLINQPEYGVERLDIQVSDKGVFKLSYDMPKLEHFPVSMHQILRKSFARNERTTRQLEKQWNDMGKFTLGTADRSAESFVVPFLRGIGQSTDTFDKGTDVDATAKALSDKLLGGEADGGKIEGSGGTDVLTGGDDSDDLQGGIGDDVLSFGRRAFSKVKDILGLHDFSDFSNLVKENENAGKEGWDGSTWKAHESEEGGTDTIGYGHKLSPTEHDGGYVTYEGTNYSFEDGVPDNVIEGLLQEDILSHRKIAKSIIDKEKPSGLAWDDLKEEYQLILTDIAFNVGSLYRKPIKDKKFDWPKLLGHMSTHNIEGIRKESVTSTGGKSLSSRAKRRNDSILKDNT